MNKLPVFLFAIFFACATFATFAFAQPADKVKVELLKAAQKCCSNAPEILQNLSAQEMKNYVEDDKENFLGGFGTCVHEALHAYDFKLSENVDWDENSYPIAYFIDKGLVLSFEGKRLTKTEALHRAFYPDEVQKLFRYKTYIFDSKGATSSSNQWGFYGLLEEFNAYYHDTKAQVEYAKKLAKEDVEKITFSNELNAYFEFNIFMAYYLDYLQKFRPEEYKYLTLKPEIKASYTLMEMNWRNLLNEILKDSALAAKFPSVQTEANLLNKDRRKSLSVLCLNEIETKPYSNFSQKRPADLTFINQNLSLLGQNENVFGYDFGSNSEALKAGETISLDLDLKDANYHYITLLQTDDSDAIGQLYLKCAQMGFQETGIFVTESMDLCLYLAKFKDLKAAQSYLKSIKTQFPKAKIE